MIALSARSLLLAGLLAGASFTASAVETVTKPEAETMVRKAVAYLKAHGRENTFAEVNKKDGQFVDRDLYIVVYGLDATVHAHGANARMVGKNLMEIKDVDGKAFVKERVTMAQKKVPFWQEYKFTNPVSGKIEPKAMYCIPEEDLVVCGGVYLK
ncbi:cache domain-containing protein [Massilia endophytica]|uniref:cache domain-containing protein n=1 Tax=Massilia endophytica TaxID=2899220 RepID=UPI001E61E69C|nr:cache domain-containing protein [Massilia endophytica]UGQ46557.1 cache domain-containing protein [Massilia endophytica]